MEAMNQSPGNTKPWNDGSLRTLGISVSHKQLDHATRSTENWGLETESWKRQTHKSKRTPFPDPPLISTEHLIDKKEFCQDSVMCDPNMAA